MLIVHVGDIVFVGEPVDKRLFISTLSVFRHGGVVTLSEKEGFVFFGIQISLLPGGIVKMDQNAFASTLVPMQKDKFLHNGIISCKVEFIRTECKKFAGSVLRLLQTRYDLSFVASLFATSMVSALEDSTKLNALISLSSKICKMARDSNE